MEKQITCPECGSNYLQHNTVHIPLKDGEYMFQCLDCGELFNIPEGEENET